MDEEIKEVGEMTTIEDEEEITIEEDYTTLEAETIIIDDDSNIQTDAEYEQAVAQKELADEAREALSAVLISVLEKGEINDDDIAEITAQQEIYIENVTALKILGIETEDEKSTTNVITSNIDYNELMKVLSEKADWLYTDEDGQVMINGEVVPKLKVIELEAEKVKADVGEFKELTTENFTAVNAKIDNLDVGDLTAVNADITNLKALVAEIQTLIGGNLTMDNIQSLILTSDKVTIANALIKDAMIDTISANKINTGIINTNNVSIQSEDGSMIINGTTQQFKDENNVVRIQIGKDATGNFTFCLFSQDGKGILLDADGIKAGAVPDGLIVNDMVADNANISGGKLDISSVISSINDNENTLKSSKIKFDDTEQTLDIAFNQLKSKVETIEEVSINGDLASVIEQVTTNTTSINVMQGQISSLISNTTITKQDGTVTQLKDEYNSTKDTVNSHTQTIGLLETNLSAAEDNIKTVISKQTEFEQNLDGFKTTVHDTYVTKTEVEKTLKSVTNEYYISTSSTELIDGSWSTTVPTPQDNKYIWRRERSEFVDGSITYGDPICLTNENDDGYTILLTKDTITCLWDSSGDLGGGGDSGGGDSGGGDSTALTISNIAAKSIIEGSAFGINYSTNKAVTKHYFSWNASASSPTYTDITGYVSSNGNSHQYLENTNNQAVGTYNVAIRVETADGESKVSNIFTITITAPEAEEPNLLEGINLVNAYFNNNTGEIVTSGAGITTGAIQDYIPVTAGTTYTFKCNMNGATMAHFRYGWYNSSKTYMSHDTLLSGPPCHFTIPDGAAYIRFHIVTDNGFTYDNITNMSLKIRTATGSSNLSGTYLFYGDSICYGGGSGGFGYPQAFEAQEANCIAINYGRSGSCISKNDAYDVNYPSILAEIQGTTASSVSPDYICLEGGVNDSWNYRNPMGTFKGGTAPTTTSAIQSYMSSLNEYEFCDALEKCICEIKLRWPGKGIFYLIPHKVNTGNSTSYFTQAISICSKWNIPVIDIRNSGLQGSELLGQYTTDGTHPTKEGYIQYYVPTMVEVFNEYK